MDSLSPENNEEPESISAESIGAESLEAEAKESTVAHPGYLTLSTSPATETMLRGLTAGHFLIDNSRQLKTSNAGDYTVSAIEDNPGIREIKYTDGSGEVVVKFENMDLLEGNNSGARLFFNWVLTLVNDAVRDGKATEDYVSFPVQKLVDLGLYSSPRSAREGFSRQKDILTSIKMGGRLRYGKNRVAEMETGGDVFYWGERKRGQCKIYLAKQANWGMVVQYLAVVPEYYFKLRDKAEILCYYIFYLARQNVASLREKKYFSISLRAIQHRLCLPEETEIKNPGRDIISAIDRALEEIEEAHRKEFNNRDLQLLIVHDEKGSKVEDCKNITDYLDHCSLEVRIQGELLDAIKEVSGKVATLPLKDLGREMGSHRIALKTLKSSRGISG